VGDPEVVINFREFIRGYACMEDLNYTFSLEGGSPIPRFMVPTIKPTRSGGFITVYTKTRKDIFQNIWILKIIATDSTGTYQSALTINIDIKIPSMGPPKFSSGLSDIKL